MTTYDDYLDAIDVLAGPGKPHFFGGEVEEGKCAYAHWSAERELVPCPQQATDHVRWSEGDETLSPLCDEHWTLSQSRADSIYEHHPASPGCCVSGEVR